MKKMPLVKMPLVLLLLVLATPSFAFLKDPVKTTFENRPEEVLRMERRLEEIRSMDMKKLSRNEKKALRGEVRAIKKEMAALRGGVYISIGALILIALLLILLL